MHCDDELNFLKYDDISSEIPTILIYTKMLLLTGSDCKDDLGQTNN